MPLQHFDSPTRDPRLMEAIALASPTLSTRLESSERGVRDPAAQKKTDRAFGRYARRMATRPTPFGLFAGVGTGSFGTASAMSLGALSHWRRQIKPDMEWLLALVKSLETDTTISPALNVYANPFVLVEGGRFVLTNPSNWDLSLAEVSKEKHFNVSIRATRPVTLALELAREGSTIADLVSRVATELEESDPTRVEGLIRSLLAREFLISELRPPSTCADPMRHVLQAVGRLRGLEQLTHALHDIERLIAEYRGASPQDGKAHMQKVCRAMAPLTKSTHLLHVDLAIPAADIVLHADVGEELARAADLMWRLSNGEARLAHLREYHADFLERFGIDREVPLANLLHEELGLGPPRTYLNPPPTRAGRSKPADRPATTRLAELCCAAAARGEREVVLTEPLIDTLAPLQSSRPPPSFELYAEILAASAADLDRGAFQLVLSPIVGADDAGKTFARFLYFLPETVADRFRALAAAEAAGTGVIQAELSYLPSAARLANVALVPSLLPHEICIATTPSGSASRSISLADIVVGATPERLYLRLQPSGREVAISTTHMLNDEHLPNVLRLAVEISLARTRPFSLLDIGSLDWIPFVPRIKYHRTVISPAAWKIKRADVEPDGPAWSAVFGAWCDRWSVPRYVFVGVADQQLLLDLRNESHVEEFYERLKKQDSVTMLEMVGRFEDRLFVSDGGRHFAECVVPLIRAAPSETLPLPPARFGQGGSPDIRIRPPASEWLYLKLYCNPDRLDRLLVEHALPFAESCVSSQLADRWFYLHYRDPESHLRLRFYAEQDAVRGQLMEEVGRWTGMLLRTGLLRDMAVCPYEREIERYGGADLIAHAEASFCADSQMCARLISAQLAGESSLDRVQLAAVGAADIVIRTAGLAQSRSFLSGKLEDPSRFGAVLRQACAVIWPNHRDEGNPEGHWIKHQLDGRGPALAAYCDAIRSTIPEAARESELHAITASLVHMHCNRMNGDERAALALAGRITNWIVATGGNT